MTRVWARAFATGVLFAAFALPTASASQVPPAPPPYFLQPLPPQEAPPPVEAKPEPAPVPVPAQNPAPFSDLPKDHWAAAPILQLYQAGVIQGDPQGRFRPDDPVTRAELFKMVLAARRINPGTECQAMFRDVPCKTWYAPIAETAYRLAVAEGTAVDHFSPEAYVDRQQLITVLVRGKGRWWESVNLGWAEVSRRLNVYKDHDKVASWARPPLALAVGEKLAAGYQDGTLRPTALASRAEAAALISRALLPADGLHTVQIDGLTIMYKQQMDMTATMYATGEPGVGTITYTGLKVRLGAIAVDPKVIPLGSLLYVEGYGYGIAADTGGAIKGHRIDLFTHSHRLAALEFGVQKRKVWVLP